MDARTRRQLVARLNAAGEQIAGHFDLRYRAIQADRANATSRYGICYSDGTIRIRLRHARTGRSLKYSSLVNTLCHELAHLRHFNHGPAFKRFYFEILAYARRTGLYQPGARQPKRSAAPPTAMAPPAVAAPPRREAPTPRRSAEGARAAPGPRQLSLFLES